MRVQLPSGWAAGLKWGAIVGIAMYAAGLLLQVFSNALVRSAGSIDETQHPILLVPTCLGLFALLFAFSAAGFYTGRETGRAALGALAGVVTLIVQYVLGLIYTPGAVGASTTTTIPAGTNMTVLVLANITSVLLVVGIAGGMGWLGGRPGARRSPLAARLAASAQGPIVEPVEPPADH